jgi:hypothetical protein
MNRIALTLLGITQAPGFGPDEPYQIEDLIKRWSESTSV